MGNSKTDTIEFYLRGIAHSIEQKQNKKLAAYGITVQQGRALRGIGSLLKEGEAPTQKNLQAKLGITSPSTTSLLQALEKKGLITRESSKEDNRAKHLNLTKRGRALANSMQKVLQETSEIFLESITPQEKKLFEQMLKRVYENFAADASG